MNKNIEKISPYFFSFTTIEENEKKKTLEN
jgi:hypothetical protein